MTIEYVPRPRAAEGRGWDRVDGSPSVPSPRHDEVDGVGVVRVPVVPRRLRRPRIPVVLVLIVALNFGNVTRWARGTWSVFSVSGWLAIAVSVALLVVVYRALRLRRFADRDRLDVLLSAEGIHTGAVVVPWSQVEGIVRFGFAFGPGRGGPGPRHFLAVRVTDFVAVRGLTPGQAGLANLTRRHLLVLGEARELHAPSALADALEELVENPASRELLSGVEGVRLVTSGPAWRTRRP